MDSSQHKKPVSINGIRRWVAVSEAVRGSAPALTLPAPEPEVTTAKAPSLLREALGIVLRQRRTGLGLSLREVAQHAQVSIGHVSEVERGKKEASSEVLAHLCGAVGLTLSGLLLLTCDVLEGPVAVPDTIPASVLAEAMPAKAGRP